MSATRFSHNKVQAHLPNDRFVLYVFIHTQSGPSHGQPFIRTEMSVPAEEVAKNCWSFFCVCVTSGCHPWQRPFRFIPPWHAARVSIGLSLVQIPPAPPFCSLLLPRLWGHGDQPCRGATCWLMCVTQRFWEPPASELGRNVSIFEPTDAKGDTARKGFFFQERDLKKKKVAKVRVAVVRPLN